MSGVTSSTRPLLVSCDESGIGGKKFYGFGSLWMSWDRRGDFVDDFRRLGVEHGVLLEGVDGTAHEFKWSKVKRQKIGFYKAAVNYFFARPWLSFHCLVVRKADVDLNMHDSFDQARRKHFAMLLVDKIKKALAKNPLRSGFHIWVDPIASSYEKADEALKVIVTNQLKKALGTAPPVTVTTWESHETPSIQLCDVLLGAVMSAWQGETEAEGKLALRQHIAGHVSWKDLNAGTFQTERKFNIWYFYDPTMGAREVSARAVRLAGPPSA